MKITRVFGFCSLVAATLLFSTEISTNTATKGIVNYELVNVRSTPSLTEDNVVGRIRLGTIVNIKGKEGNWVVLESGNYVDGALIDQINTSFNVVVNCDFANIRSKPSFDKSSRIRFANKGDLLESVAITDDWIVLADSSLIHKSVVEIPFVANGIKLDSFDNNITKLEQVNATKNIGKQFNQKDKADILSTLEVLENVLANLIDEKEQIGLKNREEQVKIQHQINILRNNISQLENAFNNNKADLEKVTDSYYLVTRNAFKRKSPTSSKESFGFIYRGNIVKVSEKTTKEYYRVDNYWLSIEHLVPLKQDTLIDSFVKYSNFIVDDINLLKETSDKHTKDIETIQSNLASLQLSDKVKNEEISSIKNSIKIHADEVGVNIKRINDNIIEFRGKEQLYSTKQDALNLEAENKFKTLSEKNKTLEEKIVSLEKLITDYQKANNFKNSIVGLDRNFGILKATQEALDERVTRGFILHDTRMENIEKYNNAISSSVIKGAELSVNEPLKTEIASLKEEQIKSTLTIQSLQKEIDVLIKLSKKDKK